MLDKHMISALAAFLRTMILFNSEICARRALPASLELALQTWKLLPRERRKT